MPDQFSKITIQEIISSLKEPLPGQRAHMKMLPGGRSLTLPTNYSQVKKSAVLILLFYEQGLLHFCLTKRNSNLKNHPGQISFPGGRCEKYETDPWETALRETDEEIGIPPHQIQFLGKLSDVFVSVSNFNIHPYIGFIQEKPTFIINHKEVEKLIVLPLHSLFTEENHAIEMLETRNGKMNVPCYLIEDHVIWGATSMMIAELEVLLKQHYSGQEEHLNNADSDQES
ncbi:MAG: CoA pyrophosphatase [Prolixibacteraceae bacterium]